MTDTDARLRNQLRWTIHALLLAGLGLLLMLVTVAVVAGGASDPKYTAWVLLAIWGFFAVYAGGTSGIVWWKATTWLHVAFTHAASVGAIVLCTVAIGAFFFAVR